MDYKKKQEIPFGAFDSELMYQEISIPEGFEATIEGNKIIFKKIESDDEKIRKELIKHLRDGAEGYIPAGGSEDYTRWLTWLEKQVSPDMVAEAYLRGCNDTEKKWVEKQGEQSNNEDVEKEKNDYVSGQFLYCKGSFNEFKEGESYWLEYVGNDNYIGRSDNILNQKFHITPRQLYTWLDPRHAYNCNETNAPTEQGEKDSSVKPPTFTFDDVLALQCCMKTVKKVQEDKDLYEKLKDIHGRVYDAYQLEKQDEQKPIDKVEPKYKAGDWIVSKYGDLFQIKEVVAGGYELLCPNDNVEINSFGIVDKNSFLWSIAYARPGDILVTNQSIFIFKGFYIANKPKAYCGVMNGSFINCPEGCWTNEQCYPATKEERNILFQKMKEAGFEWDAEKKELKLVITNGGDFEPELSHKEVTKKSDKDKEIDTRSLLFHKDDRNYEVIKLIRSAMLYCPHMEEEDRKKVNDWLKFVQSKLS